MHHPDQALRPEEAADQALRPEEAAYQREITNTYKDSPELFVTHCSDLLHMEVGERDHQGRPYHCLLAKSGFAKYDVVAEVRGSVISYGRLRRVVEEGLVARERLPVLLFLNFEQRLLLSPKNITKYLFTAPRLPASLLRPHNCYLENHFGSKLLVTASRDIAAGEELVLEDGCWRSSVFEWGRGFE